MPNADAGHRWFAFIHYDGRFKRRRKERVFTTYAEARDWHDRLSADTDGVVTSGLLPEWVREQTAQQFPA